MTDRRPGGDTNASSSPPGTQPTAIGYLRTDLCGHRGFVTARLRLAAIAHGYRFRRLVELPADPDPDHLTTLRAALDRTGADAVIIAAATHLPGGQLHALRTITPVIVDAAGPPEPLGLRARLRALLGPDLRQRRDGTDEPIEFGEGHEAVW
ncbi:hypothetical protein [Nocardia sp. NPDC003963]